MCLARPPGCLVASFSAPPPAPQPAHVRLFTSEVCWKTVALHAACRKWVGGLAASQMAATAQRWAAAAHPAAGREHAAPAGVDQLHLDLQLPVHHSTGITHAGMCSQPMYTLTVADTGSGPAPVSVPFRAVALPSSQWNTQSCVTALLDSMLPYLHGLRAAGEQQGRNPPGQETRSCSGQAGAGSRSATAHAQARHSPRELGN